MLVLKRSCQHYYKGLNRELVVCYSFHNFKKLFFTQTVLFPLIFDVFPSFLVCNPDLFSLNRFMTFEQRYTTVAFISLFSILCNPYFLLLISKHPIILAVLYLWPIFMHFIAIIFYSLNPSQTFNHMYLTLTLDYKSLFLRSSLLPYVKSFYACTFTLSLF